ncbi:hypothetical protein ES703_32993 [subsurface metagenome]
MSTRGNEYYSLRADREKNRVYFSMQGAIPKVDAIKDFMPDWRTTVGEVKEGFTILGDLSKCEPLPEDVDKLNEETQAWIMAQGCKKVAQLVGDINLMSQVNEFAEKSGMRDILRAFFYVKGAEMWLDMK